MRLFAVSLLLASSIAQANSFTFKSLVFNGEMPYVESSNKEVALKINTSIYTDMLEMPAPESSKAGIKNVPESMSSSQSDIRYTVWRNDGKILSIEINAEGCGAYCESYSNYFNFDATNGNVIEKTAIFTSTGLAVLNKRVVLQRIARINKEIARLKQESKKTKPDRVNDDNESYFKDSIALYEECKAGFIEETTSENQQLLYNEMKFDKNQLVFIRERCSNHAVRALDNLDIFENTFLLKEISPYLSAYGKKILPFVTSKK